MTEFRRYPHIANLQTMKPNPRILLGKRLLWQIKEDGSCMTVYWKDGYDKEREVGIVQISSRNLEDASQDLKNLVTRTEDYPKIIELLKDEPHYIIYCEACPKGRSVTGIKVYERDILFVFDIYDKTTEKYLPYTLIHQECFHRKIPCVKLYAETRHRTMKDLLKFKNHIIDYCNSMNEEGMVVKYYGEIPEQFKNWHEFDGNLIMTKVKIDVPEPILKKISKGEVILPPMPQSEVMGCIDKAYQELGKEKFKDVKIVMPIIARYVSEASKQHLYSNPRGKLYTYYLEYLERLV